MTNFDNNNLCDLQTPIRRNNSHSNPMLNLFAVLEVPTITPHTLYEPCGGTLVSQINWSLLGD
jgi:hypothetical protein